ncbi:hypothetical protein BDY24DRAFT_445156 [Mrakia frigida]|uniref:uncharacterized protein n=1 Tax=Mrakia frigida TaxID=29902 RepID=UPI003FCC1CF0
MSTSLLPTFSQASTSSSVYSLNTPPLPLLPTAESLLPHLDLAPHDLLPLLRHALITGAQTADVGLIKWLLSLSGDVGHLLPLDLLGEDGENLVSLAIMGSAAREEKEECVRMLVRRVGVEGSDSAGWTPLHLAALHSTPPLISFLLTSGADPHAMSLKGFTPLDMISDLPSHSSQTALLTSAMISIPPPMSSSSSSSNSSNSSSSNSSSSPLHQPQRQPSAALSASVARAQLAVRNERKEQIRWEKENWIKEIAGTAEVDGERLLSRQWEEEEKGGKVDKEEKRLLRRKRAARRGRVSIGGTWTLRLRGKNGGEESGSGSELEEEEEEEEEAFWEDPQAPPPYHTLLVFSLPNLPSLLDTLISDYPPNAHPRSWRSAPANCIYLFARFALYRCDEDWLEELIVGVVDRIEKGVYDNVEDLAHLAFWNYNTTLLLHLLRSDSGLEISCHEMSLLVMLEELINAIHVFVIRVVEKRIDSVLDAALLDYQSMEEEFGDVTFEGEWNFLKSLTGRGATTAKKAASRIVPKAKDLFPSTSSPRGSMDLESPSSSLSFAREGFGSLRESGGGGGGGGRSSMDFGGGGGVKASSSTGSNGRPMSMADFRSPVGWSQQGTSSNPLFNSTSSSSSASNGRHHPIGVDVSASSNSSSTPVTPRTITSFLTSVLVVLQLYEVNPAITCQAFSQVYYWVGCETFNRILTRKKYLCRSKAVQIRMNMTSLEDWVRDSGLPVKIATKHLEPVNQLLGWLQTCSSLNDFDNLIVMVQSLRSLNPLQMRRATKDYRFEVNEGKMSDECAQYLAQLQKDWEKRRVRIGVEALQREISEKERARLEKYGGGAMRINSSTGSPSLPSHSNAPSEDRPYNPALLEPATHIDALFDPSTPLGEYNPPTSPECMGELLDSRFMLPFSLPTDVDLLVATPPEGAAFALLHLENGPNSNNPHSTASPSLINASPRPSSRTSFSSLRPLRYAQRTRNSLKELPDQFLGWLDEQEQSKMHRESSRLGSRLSAAVEGTRSSSIGGSPSGRTPTGTGAGTGTEGGYSSSPSSSSKQEDSQHQHRQQPTLSLSVSQSWPSPSSSRDLDLTPTTRGIGQTQSSFFSSSPSPSPPNIDDFGGYSSHSHSKEDSERTVSSHGRDGSSKTITVNSGNIRRPPPERLQTIMPNFPKGYERKEEEGGGGGGGGGVEEERVPSSAKSWLARKLPGRKNSVLGGKGKV